MQAQLPGPVPARAANSKATPITKIVVPTTLRQPRAIYRHSGPHVQVSIPVSEIPVSEAGERRRSVKLPGPIDENTVNKQPITINPKKINPSKINPGKINKFAAPDPKPLAWTTTTTTFTSTSFLDNATFNSGSIFIPPDANAAAGLNHVVDMVNDVITIHKKDGTIDFQTSLDSFFSSLGPLGRVSFDPRVIYDQYAARWVVVAVEQTETSSGGGATNTSRIFVAVSDDSNPNGTWYFAEINSVVNTGVDNWADYPAIAVDNEVVYITTNLFGFNGGSFAGARVWVLTKGVGLGGLYDGGALAASVFDPYAASGVATTTIPAHMYGTAPAGVGTFLVSFSGMSDGVSEEIQVVRFDDPLNTAVFTLSTVSLGNIDNEGVLPDMPQSGSSSLISSNDRRALDAVWRSNTLWLTTTIVPNSGIDTGEATAYWVKIDTTTLSSLALADSGVIGGEDIAAGTYTSFPSIAVNVNDDVVVGFSASAPSIFAGAYFVNRQTADSPGTTGGSVTVKAGVASYVRTFGGGSNRWGDYSGTTLDPADECFWVFNEWADAKCAASSGEDGCWGTAYAKTCPTTPPVVCGATQSIPANTWTRFSVPCDISPTNTVADIFSGLSAATYGTNWVVYKRDAATTSYVLLATTDPMITGTGYWVFTTSTTQVSLSGAPDATTDIALTGVATTGRDNYIGHNQNATVNWNQVQVVDGGAVFGIAGYDPVDGGGKFACTAPVSSACLMSHLMNKWNGSAYQVFDGDVTGGSPGTLSPFDAFWVQAFKAGIKLRIAVASSAKPASGTLSVKPMPSSIASTAASAGAKIEIQKNAGKKIEGRDIDGRDVQGRERQKHKKHKKRKGQPWYIRLVVSSGTMEDPGNVLGQRADAIDGNDPHDLEEPPPFGKKYLSVLFDNPLFTQVKWGFTTDFRKLTKEPEGIWPFVVKAYDGIREINIRLDGEEDLFEESWLVDEESGEVIKVHAGDSYTFDIQGGEHFFRFEQGDD